MTFAASLAMFAASLVTLAASFVVFAPRFRRLQPRVRFTIITPPPFCLSRLILVGRAIVSPYYAAFKISLLRRLLLRRLLHPSGVIGETTPGSRFTITPLGTL